jgi:hypothetical protein
LNGVGQRLGAEGVRRAILDPRAEAAAGFEALIQIMPVDFGQRLTATQLEGLVRYLTGLP